MTEKVQARHTHSRQAVIMRCCLKYRNVGAAFHRPKTRTAPERAAERRPYNMLHNKIDMQGLTNVCARRVTMQLSGGHTGPPLQTKN